MRNSFSDDELKNRFEKKIEEGHELLSSLEGMKGVLGVSKVMRKIKKEITFLNKVLNSQTMKNEQLLSTNLHHFHALVACICDSQDVVSVLETKSYKDNCNFSKKLCVDIICDSGRKWIKVIARNPKALSQILTGNGDYGQKSIVDHAVQYTTCGEQNKFLYESPQIFFFFASGVTKSLVNCLNKIGVHVMGVEIDEVCCYKETKSETDEEEYFLSGSDSDNKCNLTGTINNISNDLNFQRLGITTINLDISTMIAYVSALTNGGSNWIFKEPLLNEQAEWERERPVKPVLDNIFSGKILVCCETACKSFKEIVEIIGGPSEKDRTEKLLSIVKIVPDMPLSRLKLGGKIKPRSVIIFGTGYHLKAVTVTANEGFIRAAKHQNAELAVIVHESRALTEMKQENSFQL